MDRRAFKKFITKRSSIWTLSLCLTGILMLGGIAAVDSARRTKDRMTQTESEIDQMAVLKEDGTGAGDDLLPTLDDGQPEELAQASGSAVADNSAAGLPGTDGAATADSGLNDAAAAGQGNADGQEDASAAGMGPGETAVNGENAVATGDGAVTDDGSDSAREAVSDGVISEQALVDAGISFSEAESLLWPAAGTILIDYSMDGSVYFPTLKQYKYNPALIIGSETGNQVLASAKGIVESIRVEDETGITLVMNIGNGYKLTYGQLKELAVQEGDIVEAGALLGYVSEPTKYYSVEGSNLYFGMTQDGAAVDPVLYLE